MKMLPWEYLRSICWKFHHTKPAKFTQAEYDTVFRSPVWASIIQLVSSRISMCFDVISNVDAPEKSVEIARHAINNAAWILSLETTLKSFIEDNLVEDDKKVREIVCDAVRILSNISISGLREESNS